MKYKCKECDRTLINFSIGKDGIRYISVVDTIKFLEDNNCLDLVNGSINGRFSIKCDKCGKTNIFNNFENVMKLYKKGDV